jgi:hypothetical protein
MAVRKRPAKGNGGIIARELGERRFSLTGFHVRRIRRIFPALIVVLVAVLNDPERTSTHLSCSCI